MRTVSAASVVAGRERIEGLPSSVQEALGELAGAAKEGLLALSVGVGLGVLDELMEAEVDEVVGPKGRHNLGRTAVRHGHQDGEVTLGGRRVPVERPRARTAEGEREVELVNHAHFASRDPLADAMLERMRAGVSTRRYARTGEPVGWEIDDIARSTSKSAVSREFVSRTREHLIELMSHRLDDLGLAVVMLDGIDLKGRCCVVALGIDSDGVKHPLGLWDGSAENATVATTLLSNLVERGLDVEHGVLVVLDGARRSERPSATCSAPTRRCSVASATRNVMKQPRPRPRSRSRTLASSRGAEMQQFVGLDWATRRARWCAITPAGAVIDEGWIAADEHGLTTLVARLGGDDVLACLEMMSGAAWVRERLTAGGWIVQIPDARKAKAVGSLAAKIDKLDARVLAELARRDLVPQVHVPTFADRELKERLGRRMHMVRLRTSAMNRAHGILSQFAVKLALDRLRGPDREELFIGRGVPEVWRRSIAEAVGIVRELDMRLIPTEALTDSGGAMRVARERRRWLVEIACVEV